LYLQYIQHEHGYGRVVQKELWSRTEQQEQRLEEQCKVALESFAMTMMQHIATKWSRAAEQCNNSVELSSKISREEKWYQSIDIPLRMSRWIFI
jgi:hypothetical protein